MSKNKKFYETDEFAKIQAVWTKKLQASGFVDIDSEDSPIIRPQEFYTDSKFAITEDHYEFCQRLLAEYRFRDTIFGEIDQFVMELHLNGVSVRDISSAVEREFGKKMKKTRVDELVKNLKVAFKKQILGS